MSEGVTLEQIKALFKEELTPLKEAITSMASKLEDHEASLEDVNLRLKVLEEAPAQSGIYEELKSEMSTEIGTMKEQLVISIPQQIEQVVEDKIVARYEEKMLKLYDVKTSQMTERHQAQSTHLVEQLVSAQANLSAPGKGGCNYENKVLFDTNMAGERIKFFADHTFRKPHGSGYINTNAQAHIAEHPFSATCDTRGQIDTLFKLFNFQDKGIYQNYNSYLEYRYGIEFHNSCKEWVVKHSLSRPHLEALESEDVKYYFIDGHDIYKFDENSYLAYLDMLRTMVKDEHYVKGKLTQKWHTNHDETCITPTEFDSAAAAIAQAIMQFYDNLDAPNPNTEVFYELLSSGKFKGQNLALHLVAKIIQLNSRGDEAEYVRLRALLDGMTFSTEQGDNIRDFLHAVRKVIIETAKRSSFTRKELEATIMPKLYRLIALEYDPANLMVQSHSESDKSVTKFNETMKPLSFAIMNPDHCKFLYDQHPGSADPYVKAYKAVGSLDLTLAFCDEMASKTSLTLKAIESKWTPDLKPTYLSSGISGKSALATKLMQAYSAGANSNSEPPSSTVPPDKSTLGEHGNAARKSRWGPYSSSTFEDKNHKDQLNPSFAGSRTSARTGENSKFSSFSKGRHRKFGDTNADDWRTRNALKHPDIRQNPSGSRSSNSNARPPGDFVELLKYIRRVTLKSLQETDPTVLVEILNKLNKAVHEALSAKSSEGALVAQEATEAINLIDTVASHALASTFEENCFDDFDTREKCNIINENFQEEHVRAYLANMSNTGSNESEDDSYPDFHRGEET